MLVTDAMPSVGSSRDSFMLQGKRITVKDGVCVDENGVLVGLGDRHGERGAQLRRDAGRAARAGRAHGERLSRGVPRPGRRARAHRAGLSRQPRRCATSACRRSRPGSTAGPRAEGPCGLRICGCVARRASSSSSPSPRAGPPRPTVSWSPRGCTAPWTRTCIGACGTEITRRWDPSRSPSASTPTRRTSAPRRSFPRSISRARRKRERSPSSSPTRAATTSRAD